MSLRLDAWLALALVVALAACGPILLLPGGELRHVVYMVPFDADRFVSEPCAALAGGLPTAVGETLPVLRVQPGWRIEARGERLHCSRPASGNARR